MGFFFEMGYQHTHYKYISCFIFRARPMEKLFQIPGALYLEPWNRLDLAGNTRMSKIRPLLRDGVEMEQSGKGRASGGILGVSALWKSLVAVAWICFKVFNVGQCQLLLKLHVMGEGLGADACLCGLIRLLLSGSINNIFPTDVLTLINLLLACGTTAQILLFIDLVSTFSRSNSWVFLCYAGLIKKKERLIIQNQMALFCSFK